MCRWSAFAFTSDVSEVQESRIVKASLVCARCCTSSQTHSYVFVSCDRGEANGLVQLLQVDVAHLKLFNRRNKQRPPKRAHQSSLGLSCSRQERRDNQEFAQRGIGPTCTSRDRYPAQLVHVASEIKENSPLHPILFNRESRENLCPLRKVRVLTSTEVGHGVSGCCACDCFFWFRVRRR